MDVGNPMRKMLWLQKHAWGLLRKRESDEGSRRVLGIVMRAMMDQWVDEDEDDADDRMELKRLREKGGHGAEVLGSPFKG